jgi:group I intron endonuclease
MKVVYGYIYKTINLLSGKLYIGQKVGVFNSKYYGSGLLIKRALKIYGVNNFVVEVIAYADNKEELDKLEKLYITEYRNVLGDKLYNIANGGHSGPASITTKLKIRNYRLGRHLSENTKLKISNSLFGRHHTKETRRKMRCIKLGRCRGSLSAETKLKISNSLKGRLHSEEHKRKISLANKGQIPWSKGKRLSEKHKRKISDSHKNKANHNLVNYG